MKTSIRFKPFIIFGRVMRQVRYVRMLTKFYSRNNRREYLG